MPLPAKFDKNARMARNARQDKRPAEGRLYRMSELVEASGVSRDMIKYYLRARLLPKPRKPRPNLSLYTEDHLALIRMALGYDHDLLLIADIVLLGKLLHQPPLLGGSQ